MSRTSSILYLITVSEQGGAQKYVRDLASAAATQFKKVYVVYGTQGQGVAFQNLPQNVEQHVLKNLVRSINPIKDFLCFLDLLKFLRTHPVDVVHANSSKAGFLGRLAAKICKVPCVVYTVHGYVFREPLGIFTKVTYWILEWLAARWTHVQISVNREDAEYTQKRFKSQKTMWIPNGIAMPQSHAAQKSLNQKRLGTVANFYASKNHAGFLPTLQKLLEVDQSYRWLIVGDGPLRASFEKKVAELDLSKHVTCLGYQNNIAEFLGGVDVFILPSVKEGMPYTILEAMACEVPVVASAVGGVRDVIADRVNGLHLQSRPEDAAHQISSLFSNDALRQKIVAGAKQDFLAKYTLENMVQKTLAAYT